MNAARTAVHSDVVGVHDKAFDIEEGMVSGHIFELASGHFRNDFVVFNTAGLHGLCGQCLGNDEEITVPGLDYGILFNGIEGNSAVSGKCPGRGCPDDEVGPIEIADCSKFSLVVLHLKLYED